MGGRRKGIGKKKEKRKKEERKKKKEKKARVAIATFVINFPEK